MVGGGWWVVVGGWWWVVVGGWWWVVGGGEVVVGVVVFGVGS